MGKVIKGETFLWSKHVCTSGEKYQTWVGSSPFSNIFYILENINLSLIGQSLFQAIKDN